MSIEDRLRTARQDAGYSSAAASAEAFGWSKPTYRSHENGSRGIPRDKLAIYARAFKVNVEWLLTGRNKSDPITKTMPEFLPVLGKVQGGAFVEAVPYHDEIIKPVAPDPEFSDCEQYLLEVIGPSMNKFYPEGSFVHCVRLEYQEDIEPQHEDHVIVERMRGSLREVTIKEYILTREGPELWPRSYDPNWQSPVSIQDREAIDQVRITALVIGFYFSRKR